MADSIGYMWVCGKCYSGVPIVNGTPLMGLSLDAFDLALKLFERSYHPMSAKHIHRERGNSLGFMLLIRKCYSLYFK